MRMVFAAVLLCALASSSAWAIVDYLKARCDSPAHGPNGWHQSFMLTGDNGKAACEAAAKHNAAFPGHKAEVVLIEDSRNDATPVRCPPP
jgi:hypothetical protein